MTMKIIEIKPMNQDHNRYDKLPTMIQQIISVQFKVKNVTAKSVKKVEK